ncbi:hypothetical protein MUK42_15539 [Musa troglodytarum]|uniref:Uncharacterized protein n=1 Tax=Musa troglodytarum TaxID=320322 RepID=A0A9E7H156_9LILI|nr:hypothetical protein MUK42_15539 [Musa troglodytarum]
MFSYRNRKLGGTHAPFKNKKRPITKRSNCRGSPRLIHKLR